jgi:hypothetical protein
VPRSGSRCDWMRLLHGPATELSREQESRLAGSFDAMCLREAGPRSDDRTQHRADGGKYDDRVSPTGEIFGRSPIGRSGVVSARVGRAEYTRGRRPKPIGRPPAGAAEAGLSS